MMMIMNASGRALARCAFALAVVVGFAFAATGTAAGAPANVIIILADDMGYSDLGSYGGEISTPHLDRLAADGLRFTQFYNSGRCCPSRASLMTGVYSHRAGVGHMDADLGEPAYRGVLSRETPTIAEALAPAGYRSYMVGKWHLGRRAGELPNDRGFHRFYGSPTAPGNYFRVEPDRPPLLLDGEPVTTGDGWYATDAFTDYAIRFLREHDRETPFFLYVAYTAPHWPLHAKPEDIARYRGKYRAGWDALRRERHLRMLQSGLFPAGTVLSARDPESIPWAEETEVEEMDLRMAVHAAMVDNMDRNIGRLVATLDELRVAQDTTIFFLSDNGAAAEGGRRGFTRGRSDAETGSADAHTSFGLSWANLSNAPFRRFKSQMHEGGIATPLIVHGAVVPAARRGQVEAQPAHVIDLLPTCLALAGLPVSFTNREPPGIALDGINLLPALGAVALPARPLYFEHQGNRAIRSGEWKLVAAHGAPWSLFNLDTDRTETHDLAAADPERLAALEAQWNRWAENAGVLPWPVKKAATNVGGSRITKEPQQK